MPDFIEADEQFVKAMEEAIDEHGALLKHCLSALVAAGVPLSCGTAGALRELADQMQSIIHSSFDEEPE